MKPARRWLQYSLRSFLVLLTALAVWLGVVVNRAREQREAVEAIEALGGQVVYDWDDPFADAEEPAGLAWLRRVVGDDYFQNVERVDICLSECKVVESISHLKVLRHLKELNIIEGLSSETEDHLTSTLPHCLIMAWDSQRGLHVGKRLIGPTR